MLYRDSILLFHGIKIIHACFYRILSWFQFYSPHSLSLTKFPRPPWSRHLPLGRLGPTPGNRGGARLLPQLPGEVSPAPALPSVVWVSAPCGAGSRLPGGRPGQAGRQGGPAVGVRGHATWVEGAQVRGAAGTAFLTRAVPTGGAGCVLGTEQGPPERRPAWPSPWHPQPHTPHSRDRSDRAATRLIPARSKVSGPQHNRTFSATSQKAAS